jgi:hypothetical protein
LVVDTDGAVRSQTFTFGVGAISSDSIFGGDFYSKLRAQHRGTSLDPFVCVGLIMVICSTTAKRMDLESHHIKVSNRVWALQLIFYCALSMVLGVGDINDKTKITPASYLPKASRATPHCFIPSPLKSTRTKCSIYL